MMTPVSSASTCSRGRATISDRLVPCTVFLEPQLGRVGLSEREAREKGFDIKVFTLPMNYVR